MEETRAEALPLTQKEREFSGNTREVYCQILGCKEMPKSPKEMPDSIFLPSKVLGNFEKSILTSEEHLKERSQFIDWRKGKGFSPTRVFEGFPMRVSTKGTIYAEVRAKLGRKSIFHYHTHPEEWSSSFSPEDIASFKARPELSFIFAVGSLIGAVFLCQTKESEQAHLGRLTAWFSLFRLIPFFRTVSKLRGVMPWKAQETVRAFEDLGFAFYRWFPPKAGVQKGDLKEGITIQRIRPET